MKTLEFKFRPQEVKISAEEILADLNYPARSDLRRNGHRERSRHPRAPR